MDQMQFTKTQFAERLIATYRSWLSMRDRCDNKNNIRAQRYYHNVSICERWRNFYLFLLDLGLRPEGTSLGRLLDTGDYMVGNARWMSRKEQGRERIRKRLQKKYGSNFGGGSKQPQLLVSKG
jgi:hypothetical protein